MRAGRTEDPADPAAQAAMLHGRERRDCVRGGSTQGRNFAKPEGPHRWKPQRTLIAAAGGVRSRVMSALRFNVVYEDAGETGWVYAHVPELPEVHTQGEDLEEARAMVKDAIELVLSERRERGEAIPAAGTVVVESVEIAA